MSFPQTREFIKRIADLLVYLLPHYIREGKSYLTVGFGCTGGQHRSVLIAQEMQKALAKLDIRSKCCIATPNLDDGCATSLRFCETRASSI